MSYRAGIFGSEPRLICDGCGWEREVTNRNGMPFAWLLNRKRAPGWGFDGSGDMRRDWCPSCVAENEERLRTPA